MENGETYHQVTCDLVSSGRWRGSLWEGLAGVEEQRSHLPWRSHTTQGQGHSNPHIFAHLPCRLASAMVIRAWGRSARLSGGGGRGEHSCDSLQSCRQRPALQVSLPTGLLFPLAAAPCSSLQK